ncbi:MAG: hypothetical protein AAGF02_03965 [Actinomycetota bacterium]
MDVDGSGATMLLIRSREVVVGAVRFLVVAVAVLVLTGVIVTRSVTAFPDRSLGPAQAPAIEPVAVVDAITVAPVGAAQPRRGS